jgi:hypothetical protein
MYLERLFCEADVGAVKERDHVHQQQKGYESLRAREIARSRISCEEITAMAYDENPLDGGPSGGKSPRNPAQRIRRHPS